jgi:hypothetical protein
MLPPKAPKPPPPRPPKQPLTPPWPPAAWRSTFYNCALTGLGQRKPRVCRGFELRNKGARLEGPESLIRRFTTIPKHNTGKSAGRSAEREVQSKIEAKDGAALEDISSSAHIPLACLPNSTANPAEERMDLAHSRRGRPHLLRHSVTSFSASRTGRRVEPVFTITIRTTAPAIIRLDSPVATRRLGCAL